MAPCSWERDNHIPHYITVPLPNCVIQLQCRPLLTMIGVIVQKNGGEDNVHLLPREVHSWLSELISESSPPRLDNSRDSPAGKHSPNAVASAPCEANKGPVQPPVVNPPLWVERVGVWKHARVHVGNLACHACRRPWWQHITLAAPVVGILDRPGRRDTNESRDNARVQTNDLLHYGMQIWKGFQLRVGRDLGAVRNRGQQLFSQPLVHIGMRQELVENRAEGVC